MKKIISLILSALIACSMLTAFGINTFAKTTEDVISYTLIGIEGTSYSDWTGKKSNSSAVYAGNSAGGNNSIQLRSKNNNSGIVATASGGYAVSIELVWNSNTADGRKVEIYGKDEPYAAASDLYSSDSRGTLLGTIEKGTNSLNLGKGAKYIGLKSENAALYLDSVKIVWSDTEGSSGGDDPATPTYSTSKEIVDALYELDAGQTLPGGPYTLTGVVTSVDTAWSSQHSNITVTIEVEGKSVQCYRLANGKSDKASEIIEGDTITVSGNLKNYKGTREFEQGCTLEAYQATGNHASTPTYTTPAEIVAALYALEEGKSLPGGPYTLTGTIKAINTPYNEANKNITITIEVEGKEIQCYRLTGAGVDIIDTGDTVTVTGYLKDYRGTKEFDSGCTLDSYNHIEKEEKLPETVDEIIEALYALEKNTALKGTYELTGKIKSVDTKYSKEYDNITVTITVEGYDDKPVMCYRLTGKNVSKLKVGDTITVSGSLKNYNDTREFDAGCKLVAYNPATGDGSAIAAVTVAAVAIIGCCLIGKKKTER